MAECGSESGGKVKGCRYIGLLVGLLFFVMAGKAQVRLKAPEFYLGVHGGGTASYVLFNPRQSNMSPITNAVSLGGNGGLVFRFAAHKHCEFQAELNYQHRGWATYDETTGHAYKHLHYVELPILMHLHFGSESCRWIFNLGPQIGYCVSDETHTVDHPFDWGITAGTGVAFYTRKAGIYELEIRYDFSFGGIYGTSVTDAYRMANPMDLSINLGWLMPLRRR